MEIGNCLIIGLSFAILTASTKASDHNEKTGISVVDWKIAEYSVHITVLIFLLCVILLKLIYHRLTWVASYIPESLILVMLGILFAFVVKYGELIDSFDNSVYSLTPTLFFTYLLPPIVLEASYSLYNRTFGEYLGIVLLFAIIGSILNFLIIGFSLYGIYAAGGMGPLDLDLDLKTMLLFSSLIIAVDPVAVLAIFQDISIELSLYYIVFGESLLNDAITVVLYNIMAAFAGKETISAGEIGLGIASFFTVSCGGLLIGLLLGILSCLLTRPKSKLASILLLLIAYFSYIIADTVGWSGIISMIGCGLIQAAYAFHNLSQSSLVSLRELVKMTSELSEAVIFLFIGMEVVFKERYWDHGFVGWSVVLCLLARALVTLGLCFIINPFLNEEGKISLTKQAILIYGGLRGAVAFSLAILINPKDLGNQGGHKVRLIATTTLFIVVFTVGAMGTTIKPLIRLLKIRLQTKKTISLFQSMNSTILHELMAAIEIISDSHGQNILRDSWMHFDERYLRKFLQREPKTYDQKIMDVYEAITLKLHYAAMQPEKTEIILENLPEAVRQKYAEPRQSVLAFLANTQRNRSIVSFGEDGSLNQSDSDEETKIREMPTTEELFPVARSSRRISIAPDGRGPLDFGSTLKDIIKSRTKVLSEWQGSNITTVSEGRDDCSETGSAERTVSHV